jgi:UDP-glucose 4-epimerase
MEDYYRIWLDHRDLNYKPYFSEGAIETKAQEDYHSHNTEQLSVTSVKDLLLSLPEVQAELRSWKDS